MVSSFAPHHPRVACLCSTTRSKLRCGCTDAAVAMAASALRTWKLYALAALVCYGFVDAVYHLAFCLPNAELLLAAMAPGSCAANVGEAGEALRATPLARAVLCGAADVVRVLLAARANLEGMQVAEQASDSQTLPRFRYTELQTLLPLDEIDPWKAKSTIQMTPLVAAIRTDAQLGGARFTRLLLEAGARVSRSFCWCCRHGDDMTLSTPLIASLASAQILRLLVEARAEVNGVQYEEKDCLDDYPGEMLTPLQYVKAFTQLNLVRPGGHGQVSDSAYQILREHHADALCCGGILVVEGDLVRILEDQQEVLRACRAAGIGQDFDNLRLIALGQEAKVIQVDVSDNTVRVQLLHRGEHGGLDGMGSRIWFSIHAVAILE